MASLLRSVFSILIGKSTGMIVGILFTPILVRIISQEQYGIYASVLAGFSMLALLCKGGLFDASRKTIAEHVEDPQELSTIITLSLGLSLLYGLVGTALVVGGVMADLIPETYAIYALVLSAALVFGNVHSIVRGSFYGLQQEHWGEFLGISRRVLYVVSGLGLAYLGYDLLGVFIGYTASFVVVSLLGVAILSPQFSFTSPSVSDITSRGRDIATYGGLQLVGGLSAAILYRVDILLVEYFRGSTATALYNSAIVPAEMIWFVPSAIQLAFLQHTARLWSDDDVKSINRNVKTGVKYGVLSLTLFGVGLFALAEPFLHVYFGAEYTGASLTLQILILGTFFFGISRVIIPVFQAIGWIRVTELIAVGALALNIVLNVVLIPRFGIIGAGIGTAISYVTILLGAVAIWWRSPIALVPVRWSARLFTVQAMFSATFVGLVSVLDFSPTISLIVLPPLGLLLFVGFNVIAGYISATELRTIARSVLP